MKHFSLLFLCCLLSVIAWSETVVPDGTTIYSEVTWTVEDAPYLVNGNLVITETGALTIEPGVIVKLQSGLNFSATTADCGWIRVQGKLLAQGTEADSIVFTRSGPLPNWGIILFETVDTTSILEYCRIEHGNKMYSLDNGQSYSAVISFESSKATISHCLITRNPVYGIYCTNGSSPLITNNTIQHHNFGIYCRYDNAPIIINNKIIHNDSYGIYCRDNSSGQIIGNLIAHSESYGIRCRNESNPNIINNTIVGNGSYGLAFTQNASPVIQNTIIWGNESPCYISGASPTISYSLIGAETLPEGLLDGGNNLLNIDPLFADTSAHNYALQETSPCINTGIISTMNWNLPETDISGNPRIADGYIDMGAYEYPVVNNIIADGTVFTDDVTWTAENSPYHVQGELTVAENATLTIEPGTVIQFQTGTTTNYTDENFDLGLLRINGALIAQGTETDSICFTREGGIENWGMLLFHTTDTTSILEHCRIEYGDMINNAIDSHIFLGALSLYESTINIQNCSIRNNDYGGIHCNASSPMIKNTNISHNNRNGISCSNNSMPIISHSNIFYNGYYGIRCEYSSEFPIISCEIRGNNQGIYCEEASPKIMNCIIHENIEHGIRCEDASPSIFNCDIVHNNDKGIHCHSASPIITNTILWQNTNAEIYCENSQCYPVVSYCCIEDGYEGGTAIITNDPLFFDNLSFTLQDSSACINAGAPNSSGLDLPETDFFGNTRIVSNHIDIGAYESSVVVPCENTPYVISLSETTLSNYPNPFNPETTIRFALPQSGQVELTVYNIKGQQVKNLTNEVLEAGQHSVLWNGMNENGETVASGMYFYRLTTADKTITKKMMLMK